jgi:hypothetical protein
VARERRYCETPESAQFLDRAPPYTELPGQMMTSELQQVKARHNLVAVGVP